MADGNPTVYHAMLSYAKQANRFHNQPHETSMSEARELKGAEPPAKEKEATIHVIALRGGGTITVEETG